jgi:hypothetical protein
VAGEALAYPSQHPVQSPFTDTFPSYTQLLTSFATQLTTCILRHRRQQQPIFRTFTIVHALRPHNTNTRAKTSPTSAPSVMSTYDYDEPRRHRSHRHSRDDRIDDRAPRYVETQETYVRAPAGAVPPPLAPDVPYTSSRTDIIRRPAREDSEQSIEEVNRDFPPPGGAYLQTRGTMVQRERYGPPARARSADRDSNYGAYLGDSRDRRYEDDRRTRKGSTYVEQEVQAPRRRSLSRNQKIIAAVGGAALAVGGKEIWDRKQADGRPVSRNALKTAAIGAAGAFAGYEATELYAKHASKNQKTKTYVAHQGRNGEVAEYYSEEEKE